jgi:hypothetical protein
VKMQRSHVAAVAADTAAPSGLLNQDLLHLSAPTSDRIGSAPLATVTALPCEPELGFSMNLAAHAHGRKSGLLGGPRRLRRSPPVSATRLQSVSGQPMTHRRLASSDCLGDCSDRGALLDQLLQLRTSEPAPGRVLVAVDSPQLVFLNPIAHGRFMQPKPPADLRQRQSLAQKLLQRSAIHALHCLRSHGQKCADFQPILCQFCVLCANARRRRT